MTKSVRAPSDPNTMPLIKSRTSAGVDLKLPPTGYRPPKKFRGRLYKYESKSSAEARQKSASGKVENPPAEAETENSEIRYCVETLAEKRFPGMIFDVGFMPPGGRADEYVFV